MASELTQKATAEAFAGFKQMVLGQLEVCFASGAELILTGGGAEIARSVLKSQEARELAAQYGCQEQLTRLTAQYCAPEPIRKG